MYGVVDHVSVWCHGSHELYGVVDHVSVWSLILIFILSSNLALICSFHFSFVSGFHLWQDILAKLARQVYTN